MIQIAGAHKSIASPGRKIAERVDIEAGIAEKRKMSFSSGHGAGNANRLMFLIIREAMMDVEFFGKPSSELGISGEIPEISASSRIALCQMPCFTVHRLKKIHKFEGRQKQYNLCHKICIPLVGLFFMLYRTSLDIRSVTSNKSRLMLRTIWSHA